MPDYRPSAVVRLQIRTEEFDDTGRLVSGLTRPQPPETQALGGAPPAAQQLTTREREQASRELQRDLTALLTRSRRESIPRDELEREVARLNRQREALQQTIAQGGRSPATTQQTPPETIAAAPIDDRVILGQILPRSVDISRNGIRTADTCRVTINYSDAPIDPRIVRACGIEIVIGSVHPDAYEAGMLGARDDTGPLSIVTRDAVNGPGSPVTRFVGWVDEWTDTFDGDDGDTIELTCRDMTALLIDTPLPSGASINLDLPIVQGVQALIDSIPATRGFRVYFGNDPSVDTQLGPVPSASLQPVRRARRGRVARRARTGDQKMNLWDHITDATVQLGLVPVVVGYDLRIIEPRTLYGAATAKRMVYGVNLARLTFTRKLGAVTAPTVQVRCYDPTLGRTRWAQHPVSEGQPGSGVFPDAPPQPTRASRPGVSGANPDDKILVFTVAGIRDGAQLSQIAESTWQQIARQEIEGSFETSNLESLGGADGDLLDAQSGDAVELLVSTPEGGRGTDGATLQQLQAMATEERARYLVSVGWRADVAERLAALQDATGFQTVFRVQDVRVTYSIDEGIRITVDFINFVTVRELAPAAVGASPATTNGEGTVPASPRVVAATRGNRGEAARRLQVASTSRRTLMQMRANGDLTASQFEERHTAALEEETAARRAFEGTQP